MLHTYNSVPPPAALRCEDISAKYFLTNFEPGSSSASRSSWSSVWREVRRSASEGKIDVVTVEARVGRGIMSTIYQRSTAHMQRPIESNITSGEGNHGAQRGILEGIVDVNGG